MRKNFWINLLPVCVGIVIGALVSHLAAGVSWLSWLNFGLSFGTTTPLAIDLNVLTFTFGITINITVSTVIFVVLSLLVGRAILRK